ncbi:protein DOWN-REGULATED IN DIF1 11-like [Ipomoea triloba]|uniref:protein DOWN-REGULATED IN DIF1 11-like n=1 Tax=Ipomoea triloba TaxID=35885 RepID=UPI00125D64E2|nr:protein DOWN-REGULATED IN DIF1 11-like [Ipomoea triloba]
MALPYSSPSSTILTLFIICGAIAVSVSSAHKLPDDADKYLKGLPEETRRLVEKCTEKLSWECAKEVGGALYTDHRKVSKSCCKKITRLGKKCSAALLNVLINVPELKDKKDVILANTKKLINKCLNWKP